MLYDYFLQTRGVARRLHNIRVVHERFYARLRNRISDSERQELELHLDQLQGIVDDLDEDPRPSGDL